MYAIRSYYVVILDGAHNFKASVLLGKYLNQILGNKKLTLVIGILDDKPYEAMLAQLLPRAQRVIVTKAKISRSIRITSYNVCYTKLLRQNPAGAHPQGTTRRRCRS